MTFEQILRDYKDRVYNTCLGFVGNSEEAEDLAQEVFIEVYQKNSEFRGDSELFTWIYRIAVNKSLQYLRSRKASKRFGESVGLEKVTPISHLHPGIALIQEEQREMLATAINGLGDDQRTAFTLSKIEGLSYEEISKIMGKSISSIESLMHRAKINLQKRLKHYYEEA